MQDLCCDRLPWGKYGIFISNVLPHRKYDIEYNPCLLPRKLGSVVNMLSLFTQWVPRGYGSKRTESEGVAQGRNYYSLVAENNHRTQFVNPLAPSE